MIEVTYYYSACVGIRTPDTSILCDRWFTDGIYDGSWYQYPKLRDPLETIGAFEVVYVSHIHPDHYDPLFLRTYLERYPEARVVIGEEPRPGTGLLGGFPPGDSGRRRASPRAPRGD